MDRPNRIVTFFAEFGANPDGEDFELEMDLSIIEKLVDMVGSEDDVEACAKESFEELEKSFERNEIEVEEGESAEKLAMAALMVKLVENGKLGPEEADSFIEENL